MFLVKSLSRVLRVFCVTALVFTAPIALSVPTQAEGPLCHKGKISQSINDAVLALKATQYCVGQELPYTQTAVFERIEALRCGPKSSSLIDRLMDKFDKQYRMIMTTDPSKTVCKQAALLDIK